MSRLAQIEQTVYPFFMQPCFSQHVKMHRVCRRNSGFELAQAWALAAKSNEMSYCKDCRASTLKSRCCQLNLLFKFLPQPFRVSFLIGTVRGLISVSLIVYSGQRNSSCREASKDVIGLIEVSVLIPIPTCTPSHPLMVATTLRIRRVKINSDRKETL